MLRGLVIGIGVAFGFLIGLASCSAVVMSIGASQLENNFDRIEASLDDDELAPVSKVSVSSSPKSTALDMKVETLKTGTFGTADAIIRVDNKGSKTFSMIFVECAFFDANKKVVDNGVAMITNLSQGQTGYGEANAINGEAVKSVQCRISQTM